MTGTGDDRDVFEDDPPRSIFSALWFRALVVILVLGVIAAIAVPYVLDVVNAPAPKVASKPPTPPPALTPTPPPAPAQSTPTPAPMPSLPAAAAPSEPPATAAPAKPTTPPPAASPAPAKPPAKLAESPKIADAPSEAPKLAATKPAPSKPAAETPAKATSPVAGSYWVQVGAFKDQATAKKLATTLRELNYKVEEMAAATKATAGAPVAASAGAPTSDRYDVFISGAAAADLNSKLSSKGFTADPVAGGVVVKPSLPLREAVALSKDLTAEGLKVQVRRSGTTAGAVAAGPSPSGGETLYRVRVGGFSDKAEAQATLRELETKGYKPFIARGGQ